MQRFKNLHFLADTSKVENFTLNRAVELANANRAELTILNVIGLEESGYFESNTNRKIAALRKTQKRVPV